LPQKLVKTFSKKIDKNELQNITGCYVQYALKLIGKYIKNEILFKIRLDIIKPIV
jgi:hypothetical protein